MDFRRAGDRATKNGFASSSRFQIRREGDITRPVILIYRMKGVVRTRHDPDQVFQYTLKSKRGADLHYDLAVDVRLIEPSAQAYAEK